MVEGEGSAVVASAVEMAVVTVINSEEDAVEESVIDTVAGVLTDSVADRVVDSVEETSVLTVLDSVEDSEASVYVSEAEVSVVKEEIVALNVAVELETVKLSVELDWGLHGLAFDPDSIKTAIQAVTNAWETIGSVKECMWWNKEKRACAAIRGTVEVLRR